jgi:hypothetical protein
MKAHYLLAGACMAALSPVHGQLYLIQGSPTPKYNGGYATSLLQVTGTGSVQTVSQILPGGRTGGAQWIGVSYDDRKAVFLTKAPKHTIAVLDFDAAAVVKTCDAPSAPAGMSSYPFEEWLARFQGGGWSLSRRSARTA